MAEEKKEEKKPTIFDILDKEDKIGKHYIESVDIAHSEIGLKAKKYLHDLKTKNPNFIDELNSDSKKKSEFEEHYIDQIANMFYNKAVERYGEKIGGDGSELEKSQVMQGLYGISKEQIGQLVREHGVENYAEIHEQVKQEHLDNLNKKHPALLSQHIKDEHIDDLIDKLGLKEDLEPDYIARIKSNPEQYKATLTNHYLQKSKEPKSLKKMYK